MQIEEFRKELEQFHEALSRESLAFLSGRKAEIDLDRLFADHSDLYGPVAVRDLDIEVARTSESFPSRRRSLERLRAFAVGRHLSRRTAALEQEIARDEYEGAFLWDGAPVPYTRLTSLLRTESDAGRRRVLRRIAAERAGALEERQIAQVGQARAAAAELGYGSPLEALQASTGTDYASLSASLEVMLAATEPIYADSLAGSFGVALGLAAGDIAECDTGYWRTRNEPEGFFREEWLDSSLERTFAELGIRPERPEAIALDLEGRAGKRPGAWCIPVRVPREVHIVATRAGGLQDYSVLLHETAHAHHFAWTAESLGAEYRLWGDAALSEGFGFLFEHLVEDPGWLMESLGFARTATFLRFRALDQCLQIRTQVGRLRFQIGLYGTQGTADTQERYAEAMTEHTRIAHAPELWACAADGLRCAGYLRGWIFEAMLGEYLRTRFGADWHRSRAAGNLLKEIWETGHLYTADELARELGLGPLDPAILTDRLLRGMRG